MRAALLRDPVLYGVALFAILVCAPVFRYLGWLGDEGILLHGATRLLAGDTLYRDYFEVVPPGSFVMVAGWMKVFGAGFGSARVFSVGVIGLIAALLYCTTVLAAGNRLLAALLAIAWATRAPFDNSHHWLTTAASMATAVALFLALAGHGRGLTMFVAGLFAGAAATFTQTRGALLCAALVVVLAVVAAARPRLPSALAGIAVLPGAAIVYLVVTGAVGPAAADLLAFPAFRYAGVQAVPFGSFATWKDALPVAIFPVTFGLAGVVFAIDRDRAGWREVRVTAALALALIGLLGAFPRADVAHLNYTAPLACPLFAIVTTRLLRRLTPGAARAVGVLGTAACLAAVGFVVVLRMQVAAGPLTAVSTPRGVAVRLPGPLTDELARLLVEIARVPRGEDFFFYPYVPMLAYLTERRHVGALDVFVPGYTTPERFRETCVRVVGGAQWLVVDKSWSDPRKLGAIFPAMKDPNPPEKRAFETALAQAFGTAVHASPVFELRRRSADATVALCRVP